MEKEWFEDESRRPKWPSVEDAKRRINVLIGDQTETDIAARDLIVLMRELGRVTAEVNHLKYERQEIIDNALEEQAALAVEPASGEADMFVEAFREAAITGQAFVKDGRLLKSEDVYAAPPPPTQGDVELWEPIRQVLLGRKEDTTAYHEFCAALRQRADEATRAENEACAKIAQEGVDENYGQVGCSIAVRIAAAIRARSDPRLSHDLC